jgi:hypothetical protein
MVEYKQYLIALIVIIFLICLFYPPHDPCDAMEMFIQTDPDEPDINYFIESTAYGLANGTYSNVVTLCAKTQNVDTIIKCITGYDKYYDNIIKEPVYKLYNYFEKFEDHTIDDNYNPDVDLDEKTPSGKKYIFIQKMSMAYGRALASTLNHIENHTDASGFENEFFIEIFVNNLILELSDAVNSFYMRSGTRELDEIINHTRDRDLDHIYGQDSMDRQTIDSRTFSS